MGLVRGSSRLFYWENALGSTVGVLDASGVVSSRYEYDAFGNVRTWPHQTALQSVNLLQSGQHTPYRYGGRHGYYAEEETDASCLLDPYADIQRCIQEVLDCIEQP